MRACIRKTLERRLSKPSPPRPTPRKQLPAHSLTVGSRVFIPPFANVVGTVTAIDDLVARVRWDDGIETLATARRLRSAISSEIARCGREIQEMLNQPETQPAWLTTLGIEDWEREKRFIERSQT